MEIKNNPVGWFELYVDDMNRARKFYSAVFGFEMQNAEVPAGMDEMQMVFFPSSQTGDGCPGALVKMEGVKPGGCGTMIYFRCEDCATEESRVEKAGGKVIRGKFSIGNYGFCSLVADTEGNIIGLHSMK